MQQIIMHLHMEACYRKGNNSRKRQIHLPAVRRQNQMYEGVAQLPSDARDVPFLIIHHYYRARCAELLFYAQVLPRPKPEIQQTTAELTRLVLFWIPPPMEALPALMPLKASKSLFGEGGKRYSTSVSKDP